MATAFGCISRIDSQISMPPIAAHPAAAKEARAEIDRQRVLLFGRSEVRQAQ
ncbi:MAG: hypothetical protein ABI398_01520 [Devosia sp.]